VNRSGGTIGDLRQAPLPSAIRPIDDNCTPPSSRAEPHARSAIWSPRFTSTRSRRFARPADQPEAGAVKPRHSRAAGADAFLAPGGRARRIRRTPLNTLREAILAVHWITGEIIATRRSGLLTACPPRGPRLPVLMCEGRHTLWRSVTNAQERPIVALAGFERYEVDQGCVSNALQASTYRHWDAAFSSGSGR